MLQHKYAPSGEPVSFACLEMRNGVNARKLKDAMATRKKNSGGLEERKNK